MPTLPSLDTLIDVSKISGKKDRELIARAYETAQKAHEGQTRLNGESYFNHVYETAYKLAELGMDAETISAGLLHDCIEDDRLTSEEVEREFGTDILFLVQGLTKFKTLKYRGLERHRESLRKFLVATAKDVRVLIIRFADRIHNLKTLSAHPSPEKRKRIAVETLEIYAPLANRLGMGELKSELEEHAFPYADPEGHESVKNILKGNKHLEQKHIEKFRRALGRELAENDIKIIETKYRVKKLYSLYKKLKRKNMDIEKVYDLLALRVIVPDVTSCYRALGVIHDTYQPLPGRIKDYIALPKPNGYRSIHTNVFSGDGCIIEIQIKTPQMHREAAYGIASHLAYKEAVTKTDQKKLKKELPWIQEFLNWHEQFSKSGELMEHIETDFFRDRVFAFTPVGDVIDLPEESTPIDFAYQIHTDIGNHMEGAKVNGKLVSISTPLSNGDIVDIITKESAQPSQKWLRYAKTTFAKKTIKNAIKEQGGSSILRNFLSNKA